MKLFFLIYAPLLLCLLHHVSFAQPVPAVSVQLAAGKTGSINDIIATNDGGYLCAGTTAKEPFRHNDIWLVKTSALGNIQWSKRYSDSLSETAACITETSDGSYVIAGMEYVQEGVNTFERIIVIKVNQQGEKIWTQYINAAFHNFANALCPLADGSVMLGGWINKNVLLDFTESSTFLAVIDKNGKLIKSATYGEPGYRRWVAGLFPVSGGVLIVSQNNDGGVFVNEKTAFAYSLLTLHEDTSRGYIFRVNGSGTHFTQSACMGADNTLTISGTWGSGPGNFDVCTVQFNKKGTVNWVNLTGGGSDFRPYDAIALPDGNIMVAGVYTGPSDSGDFSARPMRMRIDKNGILQESYQWNRPLRSLYAAAFNKITGNAVLAESDNFFLTPQYSVLNRSNKNFEFCLPELPLGVALPGPPFTLKRKDFILRATASQTYNKTIPLENYKAERSEVCSSPSPLPDSGIPGRLQQMEY